MQRVIAPLLVTVHDHFGITLSSESMPELFQLGAQFPEIVDFAVKDDDNRPVFVADGLLSAGNVDNRKPGNGKTNGTVKMVTLAVWAAMSDRCVLPPQKIAVRSASGV
jgi:hypothetical protein